MEKNVSKKNISEKIGVNKAKKDEIVNMLWKIINRFEEDEDMGDYKKDMIEFNKLMLYLYLLMVSDQENLAHKQKKIKESIDNINNKIKEIKANSIQLDKAYRFAQIIKELMPKEQNKMRKQLENLIKNLQKTSPKT